MLFLLLDCDELQRQNPNSAWIFKLLFTKEYCRINHNSLICSENWSVSNKYPPNQWEIRQCGESIEWKSIEYHTTSTQTFVK